MMARCAMFAPSATWAAAVAMLVTLASADPMQHHVAHHVMEHHVAHLAGADVAEGYKGHYGGSSDAHHGQYSLKAEDMKNCELIRMNSTLYQHDSRYEISHFFDGEGILKRTVSRDIEGVTLVTQHDHWPCTLNETYGYTLGGRTLWASRGCKATLKVCMKPREEMISENRDPCWGLQCAAKGYICDRRHCVCQCSSNVTLEHGACSPRVCPGPHAVCVPKGDRHSCKCPDCRTVAEARVCGRVGAHVRMFASQCAMRRLACELSEPVAELVDAGLCRAKPDANCERDYTELLYRDPNGCVADRPVDVGQCSGGCLHGACCLPARFTHAFTVLTCPDGTRRNKFVQSVESCAWKGGHEDD